MSVGQRNTLQNIREGRYWFFVSLPAQLCKVLFLWMKENQRRVNCFLACNFCAYLFPSVLCTEEFRYLSVTFASACFISSFCWHLNRCACTYTGLYSCFFRSFKPVFSMTFFSFSSRSGCLEAWLHWLPAILSVSFSWAGWRSGCVLKAVCHSFCAFSESTGFGKILLFFIVLVMKQSSCSSNFELTLTRQELRNLHST